MTGLLAAGAAPALVTYGQPTPRNERATQLVSLLDEDKAVFGGFVNFAGVGNAPVDAMTHSRDSNIDLVMYDLEHSPFDVTQLQTYMQFLLDPGAIADAGEVKAAKTGSLVHHREQARGGQRTRDRASAQRTERRCRLVGRDRALRSTSGRSASC